MGSKKRKIQKPFIRMIMEKMRSIFARIVKRIFNILWWVSFLCRYNAMGAVNNVER